MDQSFKVDPPTYGSPSENKAPYFAVSENVATLQNAEDPVLPGLDDDAPHLWGHNEQGMPGHTDNDFLDPLLFSELQQTIEEFQEQPEKSSTNAAASTEAYTSCPSQMLPSASIIEKPALPIDLAAHYESLWTDKEKEAKETARIKPQRESKATESGPAFVGHFKDWDEARVFRKSHAIENSVPHRLPQEDETIKFIKQNQKAHVNLICDAMYNCDDVGDNEGDALKRWELNRRHYEPKLVEARAWKVLKRLIQQVEDGFHKLSDNDAELAKKQMRDDDRSCTCAIRFRNMLEGIKREKTICEDILQQPHRIRHFVNAPLAYARRKVQNRAGNNKRKENAVVCHEDQEVEKEGKKPRKARGSKSGTVKASPKISKTEEDDDRHQSERREARRRQHSTSAPPAPSGTLPALRPRPRIDLEQTQAGRLYQEQVAQLPAAVTTIPGFGHPRHLHQLNGPRISPAQYSHGRPPAFHPGQMASPAAFGQPQVDSRSIGDHISPQGQGFNNPYGLNGYPNPQQLDLGRNPGMMQPTDVGWEPSLDTMIDQRLANSNSAFLNGPQSGVQNVSEYPSLEQDWTASRDWQGNPMPNNWSHGGKRMFPFDHDGTN